MSPNTKKNMMTASRPFKVGMLFALPLITLIVAVTHHKWIDDALDCYNTDQTCKAFVIPVTSTLHGVLSPRLPNHSIKFTSATEPTGKEMDILDVVKSTAGNLNTMVFNLFTKSVAGTPFVESSQIDHFNTKCNLQGSGGLNKTAECVTQVRQSYAAYALDCYMQDSMDLDYTVSPACECLEMFQNEIYGVLTDNKNEWTNTEGSSQYNDLSDAALYCSARNEHSYTVDYAGVMNTYGLAVNGMLFLAWGLFSILTRMVTENKNKSSNNSHHVLLDRVWVGFAGIAHVAIILLILIYSMTTFKTTNETEKGHAIMHLRTNNQQIDKQPIRYEMADAAYLQTTEANEQWSEWMSTQGLTKSIFFVGWLLQVAVVGAWGFCYFGSQQPEWKKDWKTYVPVLARVGTDLPLIVGFTLLGVSVMLQNGHTNYSFLDYNLFLILTICLLQHVSNVTKLFYDAVCRQTKSSVFYSLERKQIHPDTGYQPHGDEEPKQIEQRNKITTVLQFFGWIRVWIFLLVTSFCVLLLTGTNELAKALPLGNFTQSQVFVFVLALFLSNVTYDMVRELLPVQFEKHDADSARLYIITAYVLYYVVNQRLFIDKMNE